MRCPSKPIIAVMKVLKTTLSASLSPKSYVEHVDSKALTNLFQNIIKIQKVASSCHF